MGRTVALQSARHPESIGGAGALFSGMLDALDELTDGVVVDILRGEKAYSASGLSEDILRSIVRDNIEAILQHLLGIGDSVHAPRVAGRVKAEYGVPMDSLLHAYRLAGLRLWESMMARATTAEGSSALLEASSRFWGIIDRYSGVAADTYREVVEERDRRDQHSKRVLLVSILDGDFADSPAPALRALGLLAGASYAVLALQMRDSVADARPNLEERMRAVGIASFWTPWKGEHLGLLSNASNADVAAVLTQLARTTMSRGGVSLPFVTLDDAPTAVSQALLALRCVPPGEPGIHPYGSAPIDTILAAQPKYAAELRERTLGGLSLLDSGDARVLLDTLQAWFDSDGSTAACAEALQCHRNTVLHRLGRVAQLTGKSVMKPQEAAELYTALRAMRLAGDAAAPPGHPTVGGRRSLVP